MKDKNLSIVFYLGLTPNILALCWIGIPSDDDLTLLKLIILVLLIIVSNACLNVWILKESGNKIKQWKETK